MEFVSSVGEQRYTMKCIWQTGYFHTSKHTHTQLVAAAEHIVYIHIHNRRIEVNTIIPWRLKSISVFTTQTGCGTSERAKRSKSDREGKKDRTKCVQLMCSRVY